MMRSVWLALSLFIASSPGIAGELSGEREKELRNLLIQDCGSCHGLTMKGGLGPALLPEQLEGKSAEFLSAVILHGRPGTAMPPWRALLSPEEARWMADRLLNRDLP
jgi:cytochrome c55X